jgi:topoisomerase IV subunit B
MAKSDDKNTGHKYDESKIKTLSSLEHIRTRTGMYIGRLGDGSHYDDGIYILVKEVVDNAVDEFIMGCGSRVDISIEDDTVNVRDYGRGIPLGKIEECVSKINTGAKYNDDVFQFSVGLNGVGTKAVNALSSYFLVRSHREGEFAEAIYAKGKKESSDTSKAPEEKNGTFVSFAPDSEIFGSFKFREDHLARRFRMYSYLNAGLRIVYNGETFVSKNGLLDLLNEECEYEKLYEPLYYRDKSLEFALTHTNRFSEDYYSFVNGQYTSDGGTHLSAFREGILKGLNEYSDTKFDGSDVREGVFGAIAIRLKDPVFESQTKNKLGNNEIRSDLVAQIKDAMADLLHRNKDAANAMIRKIRETEKIRKGRNSVKKLARERARAVSIRVPQLKDCKRHLDKSKGQGADTMIFITEGQSAAGSMVSCRDVNTQAIYTLKGKPLNVCDQRRDALYKNIEIYNLMRSLDIDETTERLRYQHVILATDADVDGLHIRNLMITLFLRFFPTVVSEGHLQVLETPLFRVRNKQETIYCYSEAERDAASAKLKGKAEITRFKGLGEISPKEFGQFIGDDIRLSPVLLRDDEFSVSEMISFYMGKNTKQRREYIMDNLVIDAEAL